MPDLTKAVTTDPRMEASDDSEDEDYNPNQPKNKSNHGLNESDEDEDEDDSGREDQLGEYDSGDEKTIGAEIPTSKKTKAKTKNATKRDAEGKEEKEVLGTDGGLIKTRAQRAQEVHDEKHSTAPSAASTTTTQHKTDIDALWASLNNPSPAQPPTTTTTTNDEKQGSSTAEETVTIQRTYEFAGELHTETKTVPKHSQEARDFLLATTDSGNALKSAGARVNDAGKPLRRVIKRKSMLDAGAATKVQKINTLEKSRMEWSSFVDREGINEDLKRGNKAGYLDKQDFINSAEQARYNQWKAGQKK